MNASLFARHISFIRSYDYTPEQAAKAAAEYKGRVKTKFKIGDRVYVNAKGVAQSTNPYAPYLRQPATVVGHEGVFNIIEYDKPSPHFYTPDSVKWSDQFLELVPNRHVIKLIGGPRDGQTVELEKKPADLLTFLSFTNDEGRSFFDAGGCFSANYTHLHYERIADEKGDIVRYSFKGRKPA